MFATFERFVLLLGSSGFVAETHWIEHGNIVACFFGVKETREPSSGGYYKKTHSSC